MTAVVGLNQKTLSTLVDWESPLLVSAFIPIDFSAPQPTESITNTLRRLAQLSFADLTGRYGLGHSAATMLLSPLMDETHLDALPENARGVAVFVSPTRAMHVTSPITVGPAIVVGDRVDVLRLLPAVVDDVDFYALTIGKKGARLFRGRRFEFTTVPVPEMPESIDETLWDIHHEPVRNRVGSGVPHGGGGGGGGGGEDPRKDTVRQYIHMIDRAIMPVLNESVAPLVVIGVEYEAAMFINSTRYHHTVDVPVLGSPESMSAGQLHRRSWELVDDRNATADVALNHFRQLAGTGMTAIEPAELMAACQNGAVCDLLVARSLTVDVENAPVPADVRNVAVVAANECMRHRADIHVIADESLPSGVRVAAVLRY